MPRGSRSSSFSRIAPARTFEHVSLLALLHQQRCAALQRRLLARSFAPPACAWSENLTSAEILPRSLTIKGWLISRHHPTRAVPSSSDGSTAASCNRCSSNFGRPRSVAISAACNNRSLLASAVLLSFAAFCRTSITTVSAPRRRARRAMRSSSAANSSSGPTAAAVRCQSLRS